MAREQFLRSEPVDFNTKKIIEMSDARFLIWLYYRVCRMLREGTIFAVSVLRGNCYVNVCLSAP